MKKQIMTVAALGAALLAAGCTTNADRRAEQYAEAGGQMEYNIGVVKAEQERIQAEEYYAEQARQKAEAQKQAAKAKADKARAQANAKANAAKTGGSFTKTNSMAEAFKDADIVYPKSWAPFAAMEKRTNLYAEGDADGIKALEKELLAQNADHKDWCCTEELMKTTKDGKALYLHCLPADINDVSCKDGEVEASVFDRYRTPLYKEASYKPYIIAAMIFLAKVKNPQATLKALEERGIARWFQK